MGGGELAAGEGPVLGAVDVFVEIWGEWVRGLWDGGDWWVVSLMRKSKWDRTCCH